MKTSQLLKSVAEPIGKGVILQQIEFLQKSGSVPFSMTLFTVEPHCSTTPDQHLEQECWIILEGTGILHSGDEEQYIEKGDMLYFSSHQPHTVFNSGDVPLEVVSIFW